MTKNGTAKDQKGTMPHFVQSSLVQRRCHCQLLSWKLLMWPFERVLWWCCRPKDIPRDCYGVKRTSDNCECAARKCLTPSCISALCHKALLMEALDVAL